MQHLTGFLVSLYNLNEMIIVDRRKWPQHVLRTNSPLIPRSVYENTPTGRRNFGRLQETLRDQHPCPMKIEQTWNGLRTMLLLLMLLVKTRETRERERLGVAKRRRGCQIGGAVCQTDSSISHMTIILIFTAVRTSNPS